MAAENLTKKSDYLHDNEIKIMKSQKEMLQEELNLKKKKWEEEKENLVENLEKNNLEKGHYL